MNVKQVSEEKDISTDTLHYCERIGLIPPASRTKGGIRDYTEEDLEQVNFTVCMRSAGLSIEFLIEYIRLSNEGEATVFERHKSLIEESELLAKEITEVQECLERLQGKIKKYDHVLSKNKVECIK